MLSSGPQEGSDAIRVAVDASQHERRRALAISSAKARTSRDQRFEDDELAVRRCQVDCQVAVGILGIGLDPAFLEQPFDVVLAALEHQPAKHLLVQSRLV